MGLCDVKPEIVEAYIEKNLSDYPSKPQVFTDFAQMLSESGADAVTIVTPHTMHFEHGLQAIEAGKHVFMEKPMVTDSSDAAKLKDAVEKSGKILVIGYNTPCTPAFKWLREAIREGRFGKLETVTGWQTQGWAKGTVGSWRQNAALSGGGQMYDSGAHMFNSLVWSVESSVDTVFALTDNLDTPGMVYAFENARVDIDGWNGQWVKLFTGWGKEEAIELEGETQSPNDNFVDAILGRAQPQTSPLNGLIQSQLMDAIYESASSGMASKPKN